MVDKLPWGILGTGGIAKALAKALAASQTGRLVAVGSRTQEAADAFGNTFSVPRRYATYQGVLDDPEVQVVYISLPNHMHAEWAIRCARAGKHILCEKPIASNYPEAMALVEEIRDRDVFLMEAFMYRCHPQTARLVELVAGKVVGEVRCIQASFSFNFGEQPDNIRSKASMSGGGIMDVGCYTLSMSRLIAGAALGLDGPAEPIEVKGCGHIDPVGGVDTWAVASVKFPGDIVAALTCGMQVAVPAPLVVYGTQGRIAVYNPWFPGEKDETARIEVFVQGKEGSQIHTAPGHAGLYTIEVDLVARRIAYRQAAAPAMTWADSLGNMKALDEWRKSIGVVFDCEKLENLKMPISGRPLKVAKDGPIPSGRIQGVDKPVSRVIMGSMFHVLGALPKTFAMLDRYVECGGNAIDTAWVYGTEANVGQWLRTRGVRDDIVLIGKGAADVHCTPEMVSAHLTQSLERFGVERFDLWMMHRDNPRVPVGEFVDVLDGHVRAGRIRAFGGSNWTPERLQAANEYAKKNGRAGFAASSPNFSLAVWNEPMWGGCLAAVDPASREWYARTGMPLLAWSSQANGFFSGRFKPSDAADPRLAGIARVWFNDGNWERLRRVQDLSKRTGATGIQIALAYVLAQPLNIFAMIGPETMAEMRESLGALQLKLSPEDLAWLNLEA